MLQRARRLRCESTDHERLLWSKLRNRRFAQFKFRRQVPLGNSIADFVCFQTRLVIELDGGQHAQRRQYDAQRTAWLQSHGFEVVRFWNFELVEEADGAEELILRRPEEGVRRRATE
jgi:very-short-patch-repair endonuclease